MSTVRSSRLRVIFGFTYKGITPIAERSRQHRDRFFHGLGIVPIVRMDSQKGQYRFGRQVFDFYVYIDFAEAVALAFV